MIMRDLQDRIRRYGIKSGWRLKRRNEMRRILFPVLAVALIIIIMITLSAIEKRKAAEAAAEAEAAARLAEAEAAKAAAEALVDEPFVNILDKNNYELAVTWDGDLKKVTLEEISQSIEEKTGVLESQGYSVSFLLYDLNTGSGISYHPDAEFYSASAIKAPYIAWMVQTYPEAAEEFYEEIENAVMWSSNEDYFTLINNFGKTEFNEWTARAGSPDIQLSEGSFASVTCRDFTRLWMNIYDYFTSDSETAELIRPLYSGTDESVIYETLGQSYTVYSKGGWSFEGEDSYYTVQNDAGIVMKGGHPYVLTVLSDAYEHLDLLDALVKEVDQAHTELLRNR